MCVCVCVPLPVVPHRQHFGARSANRFIHIPHTLFFEAFAARVNIECCSSANSLETRPWHELIRIIVALIRILL